jgi:hypothetical protein
MYFCMVKLSYKLANSWKTDLLLIIDRL